MFLTRMTFPTTLQMIYRGMMKISSTLMSRQNQKKKNNLKNHNKNLIIYSYTSKNSHNHARSTRFIRKRYVKNQQLNVS